LCQYYRVQQAQGVLGNLPLNAKQDFDELVRSLEERFSPSNQTELYRKQLRERRQKAAESLPELGQDVRRLTNLAYVHLSKILLPVVVQTTLSVCHIPVFHWFETLT
jgi:hypothetical protein